jgi:hypothetical protein
MEAGGPLPCSQDLFTFLYPEPDESNPYIPYLVLIKIN